MAAWCTLASVAGGVVGYAIGSLLYDSVGLWLIGLYGYGERSKRSARPMRNGVPDHPAQGADADPLQDRDDHIRVCRLQISRYSLCSRSWPTRPVLRLAFLLNRYGKQARDILEKRLGLWVALGAAVVVVGIVIAVYLI